MKIFADRLVAAIQKTGNPCAVGLDPRIDLMPAFMRSGRGTPSRDVVRSIICEFHDLVLDVVADLVPVVKPQLAFFEQYGIAGMEAFEYTVASAKRRGLLVIADGKRNDISSTAEAYAKAFLGSTDVFGQRQRAFDADSMTVTPYLGRDSLLPFVDICRRECKGLFVVLKTSNPGSKDFQDQVIAETGRPLYESVARMIHDLGGNLVGDSGYSSIGPVTGATFPEEARRLRELMPRAFLLVPGYGAQGATGRDAAACFNADGLGAIVSSSRGITYDYPSPDISPENFSSIVREKTLRMIEDVTTSIAARV